MSAKNSTQTRESKKRVESLLTHLKSLPSENDLNVFADSCGTTIGNLMQIAYGGSVSAKLSKRIHEKSNEKVLLVELRPDIFS